MSQALVRAVLLDIEGTTSSLSFVKEELFPYARARLPSYVAEHAEALSALFDRCAASKARRRSIRNS